MSESGAKRSRVKLYVVVAIVLAVCVGLVGAAYLALNRIVSPEAVSSRLENMVGYPVEIGEVSLRPWGMEARVRGFRLEASTGFETVTLRLDPWAALSGEWRLRKAELAGGTWVVPSSEGQWEPFAKGALSPLWLAKHADVVLVKSGELRGSDGEVLATAIQGEFSLREDPLAVERGRFLARLEGMTNGEEKFLVESSYTISEPGDSLVLETLSISLPGLDLEGRALAALKPRPELTLDLSSGDYFGGSLELHARVERQSEGPSLLGHAKLSDAAAPGLMTLWSGLTLLREGTVDAEVDLVGRGAQWWKDGLGGLIKGGSAEIETAVIDASDPVAAVIPMAGSLGQTEIERAYARFEISDTGVLIQDFAVSLDKTVWRGSGMVGDNGALAGVILGRVPVTALRGGGSALTMVAGLLADAEGRVPVAFRVGGTMERPVLSFDLDAVVQEAADAGRPQAKSLLRAMSKADRERLRRTVDDLLKGLRIP
jgi:hypothetical protein